MKIVLLASQPEKTTRLQMFKGTLLEMGHNVSVPKFNTRNWIEVAKQAREFVKHQKPDVVHIFNVPDIIYHGFPKLKGTYFDKLIYDYRSPWAVEYGISYGPVVKRVCEHFEDELATGADIITTVNKPLADKVGSYKRAKDKPVFIIPNYPRRDFSQMKDKAPQGMEDLEEGAIIFVGRISKHEGIGSLMKLIKDLPDERFWIIGDGPFAKWYLRKIPQNARFFGWQPHERIPYFVSKASLCLILLGETPLTPYATDKSVWKLNEYLCMGKIVVASGITKEEDRKNLIVVKSRELKDAVIKYQGKTPEKMTADDYRYWDNNDRIIKEVYDSL